MKKILIVTAPISRLDKGIESFDYFAGLVSELTIKLQMKYPDVEIIIKVPGISRDPHQDQITYINAGIKNDYDCIVISSYNIDKIYDELVNWKTSINNKKLIFIDQGFGYQTEEQRNLLIELEIETPPYVQSNWTQGGEVAAESAYKYLLSKNITTPHIVLIGGNIGSDVRINGFKAIMDSKSSNSFYPSYFYFNADYDKEKAKDFFSSYLAECIKSLNPIDIIFSANDEMALGAREALFDMKKEYNEKISSYRNSNIPKIIGFDGIKDLTLLIDKYDDEFIYDTVSVDLKLHIANVVYIIENYIVKSNSITDAKKYSSVDCFSFRERYLSTKKT